MQPEKCQNLWKFYYLQYLMRWVCFSLVTAFPFSLHPLCVPWHQLPKQNLAAYIHKSFKSTTSTSVCRNSQAIKNIYQIHKNTHTKSKCNTQMLHLPQNDASLSKPASCAGCLRWQEERQMFKNISLSIKEACLPPSDASLTGSRTGTPDFPMYLFES